MTDFTASEVFAGIPHVTQAELDTYNTGDLELGDEVYLVDRRTVHVPPQPDNREWDVTEQVVHDLQVRGITLTAYQNYQINGGSNFRTILKMGNGEPLLTHSTLNDQFYVRYVDEVTGDSSMYPLDCADGQTDALMSGPTDVIVTWDVVGSVATIWIVVDGRVLNANTVGGPFDQPKMAAVVGDEVASIILDDGTSSTAFINDGEDVFDSEVLLNKYYWSGEALIGSNPIVTQDDTNTRFELSVDGTNRIYLEEL